MKGYEYYKQLDEDLGRIERFLYGEAAYEQFQQEINNLRAALNLLYEYMED